MRVHNSRVLPIILGLCALVILVLLYDRQLRQIFLDKFEFLNIIQTKDTVINSSKAPFFDLIARGKRIGYEEYKPSSAEKYVLENAQALGFSSSNDPSGCQIWQESNNNNLMAGVLQTYYEELKSYQHWVQNFTPLKKDIRSLLLEEERSNKTREKTCQSLEVGTTLPDLFLKSKQLCLTRSGWVEPLLPPMRSPGICKDKGRFLMTLDYMVHDFAGMCRQLNPLAKTILIDMGASLDFHGNGDSPAIYLTNLYMKFGFFFDHIYAFEVTPKLPDQVYGRVPKEWMSSYHWINVGVNSAPGHKFNPLFSILANFDVDDFIVVKLDVDTHLVELPLAYQILKELAISSKIDQFYFEHHVHLKELKDDWGSSMHGTIQESLQLFHDLRRAGVASHYWP